MTDPTMIMLDEPMAGVNPALTQSLLGHIEALRDDGMTVLFVEHDMHVVRHISDWVVVMAEGKIVAEGTASSVMAQDAVIDAYLGAHHDTDLGDDSLLEDEEFAAIGRRSRERGQVMTNAATEAPVLEAKNVVAGYLPGVNILNGCSLVAHTGEIVGIIGPNGAGKSTLLKAMFGLVRVHAGTVTLRDEDITGPGPTGWWSSASGSCRRTTTSSRRCRWRRTCGWGSSSVRSSWPPSWRRTTTCSPCSRNGAPNEPVRLSGGERQSLAMARALMMDPSVLLLDEPSAGLSPVRQDETFIRVRADQQDSGVSVVMVEQNARRCLQICDRGYVLDQGKDAYTGTGRELAKDPKVIQLYLGTLAQDVEGESA